MTATEYQVRVAEVLNPFDIPAGNVERVSDLDWDIEEYWSCSEHLRGIRWRNRLPGFLPA
jgi:hypothetical protein